jgi:biotin synthase
MVGIGPFIPQGDTPLAECSMGSYKKTRLLMALVRLLLPDVLMPVTTALSVLRPTDGLEKGLQVGANVIMLNFTPQKYREGYKIYDGKSNVRDVAKCGLNAIENEIESAGYRMELSRGDSVRLYENTATVMDKAIQSPIFI